ICRGRSGLRYFVYGIDERTFGSSRYLQIASNCAAASIDLARFRATGLGQSTASAIPIRHLTYGTLLVI
ncbi:MAG: hypothetical protein ACXWC3_19675, partial [Burkholderiales bacterium]